MHRHQWITFLPNFILSRFYVALYLLSYCYFILIGAGYIHIYAYICVFIYVYVYIYICLCACECMLPCIHDYMYVFYVCSFYVCWFYDFFYLWLLGQRWPNKEVQTHVSTACTCSLNLYKLSHMISYRNILLFYRIVIVRSEIWRYKTLKITYISAIWCPL